MEDTTVVLAAVLKGYKMLEVRSEDVHAEYEQSDGVVVIDNGDGSETSFATVFVPALNRHMAIVPEAQVDTFNQVFGWQE